MCEESVGSKGPTAIPFNKSIMQVLIHQHDIHTIKVSTTTSWQLFFLRWLQQVYIFLSANSPACFNVPLKSQQSYFQIISTFVKDKHHTVE